MTEIFYLKVELTAAEIAPFAVEECDADDVAIEGKEEENKNHVQRITKALETMLEYMITRRE